MKRIITTLFFITILILGLSAQSNKSLPEIFCDFGVTFEISSNPSWGYGEPVIVAIQPFSPADKAGLKVDDIIMEINGKATYLRNYKTISNWLSDASSENIRITIRNVDTYFQEYLIQRQCKSENSISEFRLAGAYSFYSLENTSNRSFSIPMKVDPNMDVDFTDYHTFDFIDEGDNVPNIDHTINSYIEKALKARGLKRSSVDPDIIVQSYYTYQPNVKYNPSIYSGNAKTWRYDSESKDMIALPILSAEDLNAETKGQYILELGVRFFDKKLIDSTKLTQIWDCKTRDFLTEQMQIQEYAQIHAPLMLLQFPYSSAKTIAKYLVNFKGFYYTGLNFDINDMKTISDIDQDSPADLAGLKIGDITQKIDNTRFIYSPEELESGYRRFIVETMFLRNRKTRFIDANGFPDCMYWQQSKYQEIADEFKKQSIFAPCFSYLYSFEKYISYPTPAKTIFIEVKNRQGQTKKVSVKPELQRSVVVTAL